MNLNQPTLIMFEEERKRANFIPPFGSNSFYNIGSGRINILTKGSNPDNYRFDLFMETGNLDIGDGRFVIAGDVSNLEYPYENFTIVQNTSIRVNVSLDIYKGKVECYGTVNLDTNSSMLIKNGGTMTMYRDSDLIIANGCNISVDGGCTLTIYGKIHVDLNMVDSLLHTSGVIIDTSAVMYVTGLDSLGTRLYSLTDYYTELSNRVINANTQGEKNFIRGIGRIGYTWTGGNPLKQYQLIELKVLVGHAILGDFKLSILGYPEKDLDNIQIITDLVVSQDTTLFVSETYDDYKYSHPELYIGAMIGNCSTPGKCIVKGSIIVDGINAVMTIDRGASVIIEDGADVHIKNGATLKSKYNDGKEVLFIDGTLVIDYIEQISTFSPENIVFGDDGKIVILNPSTKERRLLWTTPHGIENSQLYRLLGGRLEHVEYHISPNTGIGVDKYYQFYAKDFIKWYNNMRIEKAIHDGLIVWHDGGFIELYHDIIPWVDSSCTLLEASRIFKSIGSFDIERLQDVVNRLKYAGCGNIVFRFIHGDNEHEVTLTLDEIHMKNVINNPISNTYVLTADNNGELFIKNNLAVVVPENIITKESTVIDVVDEKTEFKLQ